MPPVSPPEQLDAVPVGRAATVVSVECERPTARRLMELGLLPGTRVDVVRVAPIAVQTLAAVAGDKSVSPSARVAAASKLADLAIPKQSHVELTGRAGGALRVDIGPDTPDDVLERLAAED